MCDRQLPCQAPRPGGQDCGIGTRSHRATDGKAMQRLADSPDRWHATHRRGTDHMAVRDGSDLRPAVDNRQETEVAVRRRLLSRLVGEGEAIEHFIFQKQVLADGVRFENRCAGGLDSTLKLVPTPFDHQFVQVRHGFRILADLFLCRRIEDGEPGIDVPFIRVDSQRDVYLHVLDAPDPTTNLPGKLVISSPRRSHAQEGGMSDGLRVCRDMVMHCAGEVDVFRIEAGQDILHEFKAFI